ncbi:hypothetical protein H4W81_001869 [Nonomuraea africana]|uniref:Uncharacterized protein n=1 Tax=Nonomuraea africana TaxID=46171 RepID=A0ABR9KB00_9ACTN|nr:hypothetical protein [Nonomuraea africana]
MERAVDGFFAKYGRRRRKLERIWHTADVGERES